MTIFIIRFSISAMEFAFLTIFGTESIFFSQQPELSRGQLCIDGRLKIYGLDNDVKFSSVEVNPPMAGNFPDDNTRSFIYLVAGTRIGRYRIIERIGLGGMGEVYLAEDTELKRQVALKFLSSSLASDADCRARFVREAQAVARLNHSNIVTIYEVGEFQGRPFFAMEYVEGQSLRELIGRERLSITRALDIAIQLCDGLQEAHALGIIHRDVKPSNVLIDKKGHPKLLDFGLATVKGCAPLTKAGSTFGTAAYMSPEQVLGKNVDSRSDIFSFGIVLYELLTGHLAFPGDHDATIMHSIAYEVPVPLHDHLPEAPSDLVHIMSRLLEKSPEDRYQSIGDVAIELRRLKRDTSQVHYLTPPTGGQRVTSRPPAPKLTKKRIFTFAAITILVIAFAAALLFINPFKSSVGKLKRVVVVPFHNQTGDKTLDPLGLMIADWTTQGLMQSGLVEVVRPEELLENSKELAAVQVARSTGAGIIITGSYYKIGDTLQFQAGVMDAKSRLVKAIEPVVSPVGQPMEGAQHVREKVLGALAVVVDKRLIGQSRLGIAPPKYEAYEQLVKGLEVQAAGKLLEARACFNKAYQLDTTFLGALLYVEATYHNNGEVAQADSVLGILDLRRDRLTRIQQLYMDGCRAVFAGDNNKAWEAAREAAEIERTNESCIRWAFRAYGSNHPHDAIIALRGIDAAAHGPSYWMGLARANDLLGDHKEELKAALQGHKMYPTDISILNLEIRAFAALGKVDAIRKCFEDYSLIVKQDSTDLGNLMRLAGQELRTYGNEDSAMAIFNQAVKWFEGLSAEKMKSQRLSYGYALYEARRWQDAKTVFEELDKEFTDSLHPELEPYLARNFLGTTAARLGDRERALQISDWLKGTRLPYRFGGPTYNRACIAAVLGDKEAAVALLREALSQGYNYYDVHTDMDFESLWNYPPYIELMKPKG